MKYLITVMLVLGLSCMTEAIEKSLDTMLGEDALHRTTGPKMKIAPGAIHSPFQDADFQTQESDLQTVAIPHPDKKREGAVRPMQASADLTELIANHANGLLFGALLGIMAIIASYAIQRSE